MEGRSFSDGSPIATENEPKTLDRDARKASMDVEAAGIARTPGELARLPRVRIGATEIDPPTRTLTGPGGRATLEPRAMQVLVTLAASPTSVMTRDELHAACWAGQVVGDDALTRAIAEVRRAIRTAAPDCFAIETITKTGYRLVVTAPATAPLANAAHANGDAIVATALGSMPRIDPGPLQPPAAITITRRQLVAAATSTAVVAAVGGGAYFAQRRDPRVAELVWNARKALRDGQADSDHQGVGFVKNAIALAPSDAEVWGVLALALSNVANHAEPDRVAGAVVECERAARRALALQPEQADALAALAILPPTFGDWFNAERRFTSVLVVDPSNFFVLSELGMLMQSVGRSRDAVEVTSRAVAVDSLAPAAQYRLAYQLAYTGRVAESDRVIDRARQLWPTYPAAWYARFLLFAWSGREALALQHLQRAAEKPYAFHPGIARVWTAVLAAALSRNKDDIALAVSYNLRMAAANTATAVNAILALGMLGAIDEAFAVAEGYLLRRGPFAGELRTPGQPPANEQRWRKTMMLWTPATRGMRRDRRFAGLMHDIGMTDYWRKAKVRPDDEAVAAALG